MGSEEKQKHDLRRTQNLINRCLSHRLPFLCARSSLNDVPLNSRWLHNYHRHHSSSADPLSPTVSCIGQVKRSNRVVGFPAAYRPFSSSPNTVKSNGFSNHRPRRFFSPRNLICSSAPIAADNGGTGRRRLEGRGCCKPKRFCDGGGVSSRASAMDDIVDLDPPLPVPSPPTKQSDGGGGGEAATNLWKRRSGGAALKSLQLRQIGQPSLDSAQLSPVV